MSTSSGLVDRATLEDLAAASRILADQGVFDAAGHVSMRHPGHPERFLMSRSLAPQMITADDIMEFDLDCNAIDPRGRNGFIERYLHGEILRARPDVVAVAHSRSSSCNFLPSIRCWSRSARSRSVGMRSPISPAFCSAGFTPARSSARTSSGAVSYTHLTLPTICSV